MKARSGLLLGLAVTACIAIGTRGRAQAADPLAALQRANQTLEVQGIHLWMLLVNNLAANPVGGARQGATGVGGVALGADLSLARIVNWQGATFHIQFAQYWGRSLSSDYIGTANKVQNYNYYPHQQFELSQFALEQKLDEGRLDLLVGRINATADFARTPYGCRFENALDCPLTLVDITGQFTGVPFVKWGGRVRYEVTPTLALKAGAFEINPTRVHNSGFDWSTEGATGVVVPVEVDVSAGRDTAYEQHFQLGGWYNSAPYSDPFLNSRGQPRAFAGGKPLSYGGGRAGTFAEADGVVWRPTAKSERNLALFGVVAAPFDDREMYAFQVVGGMSDTGPFAARPHDQFNVMASYIRFTNGYNAYLNDLLRKNGGAGGLSQNQYIFEVNYALRVRPGLFIVPDLQYIVNPDTTTAPLGTHAVPKNVLVVGARVILAFR